MKHIRNILLLSFSWLALTTLAEKSPQPTHGAPTLTNQTAAGRTLSGHVTDADNKTDIIGASVIIKDKSGKILTGGLTNEKGQYQLKMPAGAIELQVRFLGYSEKTIPITDGNNVYNVALSSSATVLGDAVVTGYRKIDRRKLTASVSEVKINDETVGTITNIDQALAGQVAGVSSVTSTGAPGAPVKIRIRGTASINGSQDPLWVLDGIPLEGTDIPSMEDLKDIDNLYQTSIAGINPADIDKITILKDAAATAIYGARAANGVIVITTKNGKKGAPNVTFNSRFTYNPKTDISRLNLLNSNQKVDLELDLLASDYTFREGKGDVARIINAYGEKDAYKSGGWNALSAAAQQDINNLRNINTDWNDILFRDILNQEYNMSLSGGGEKATYYTAVGINNEQGNVEGVGNKRYNLTLKTTYDVNSMLKLGASVFANERKQDSYMTNNNGFTNPVYYSRWANPYMKPYNEDGSYNYDINIQGGKEDSQLDFNIFEERANTQNQKTDHSLLAIFDGELKPLPEIKLTSQLGFQIDRSTLTLYAGQNSYAMRKDKERSVYAYTDGKRSFLPDGGENMVTNTLQKQWTWKLMAEYQKTFAKIHNFEGMLATELRHSDYRSTYTAAYGYDKRTLTTVPVIFPTENYALQFPLYKEAHLENAYVSWFGTASYTLLHRYTLGGSIRFDGSDVFGVAKKYRYLPLYSVSALWKIKQEKWLKDVEWLSNLGLRTSYGIQGNIDKNTSPYLIGIYRKTNILPGTTETGIQCETAPNDDLRWEKTQNVNVGMDFGFLDDRITMTVDYYYRRGSDLIGLRMLPLETGFSSTTINWATMENSGWEFAIGSRNIHNKHFTWTTNLNIGINHNKVLRESVAENTTYPSREGRPVGAIFAYRTAGLDAEGYPLFLTENGEKQTLTEFLKLNRFGASSLSAAEQRDKYTYIGSTEPIASGGLNNLVKYKQFTFAMNLFFSFGAWVRTQPSYSPTNYDRGQNVNADILKRWTVNNPNGTMPRLMTSAIHPEVYTNYAEYNTFQMLDIWVKRQDYVRLQSLRVAYDLPKSVLAHIGIKGASVSLEGRNLFVVGSNYDNYLDPETMGNPYATPIPKSFIFGLNINF